MKSKSTNFWRELDRPIKVLAPMAGYTDSAFRVLCRELGADVVVTELISADAIAYGKLKVESKKLKVGDQELSYNQVISLKGNSTAELLSFFEEERPLVVQLFGKYPEKFGLAAKWVSENLKPDGIDINMGCPARKVVNSDHGAALLKNSDLAVEIVEAVKANTDLPVSVKTRLGWSHDDEILEFAPKLVEAGIDTLIIHGRTYKDAFKGSARWENIFKVKEMFPDLIVIANGDLPSISNSQFLISNKISNPKDPILKTDAKYQILDTKYYLDGFAVGRSAFGKPWIFQKDEVDTKELKNIVLRHATLASETKGERGMVEFRKHLLAYLRGFSGAKDLRKQAVTVRSLSDISALLGSL